jgi:hypothetical protein
MTTLQIAYTAPDSADTGQQTASVALDGPTLALTAVCQTEIVIHHPTGQTLRLAGSTPRSESNSQYLAVTLPPEEEQFDLGILAEPSGTAVTLNVTTKKESSKPDPPRRASF